MKKSAAKTSYCFAYKTLTVFFGALFLFFLSYSASYAQVPTPPPISQSVSVSAVVPSAIIIGPQKYGWNPCSWFNKDFAWFTEKCLDKDYQKDHPKFIQEDQQDSQEGPKQDNPEDYSENDERNFFDKNIDDSVPESKESPTKDNISVEILPPSDLGLIKACQTMYCPIIHFSITSLLIFYIIAISSIENNQRRKILYMIYWVGSFLICSILGTMMIDQLTFYALAIVCLHVSLLVLTYYKFFITKIHFSGTGTLAVLLLFAVAATGVHAQVMQSSSYKMISDSVNVVGNFSTSNSFMLDDTTGEIATGFSNSNNYSVHAGFQQVDNYYLDLDVLDPSVILSPAMLGPGTSSTGTSSLVVTTNFPGGYSLTAEDQTPLDPLLVSSTNNSFDDYVPSTPPTPDYNFLTPAAQYVFGFSVNGEDISQLFRSNGTICNTGTLDNTLSCWGGFSGTPTIIATRSSQNELLTVGQRTLDLELRAEIGSSSAAPAGTYSGSVTIIAVPHF